MVFLNSHGKSAEGIFSRRKARGERAEDALNRLKFNHSFMNISYQRIIFLAVQVVY